MRGVLLGEYTPVCIQIYGFYISGMPLFEAQPVICRKRAEQLREPDNTIGYSFTKAPARKIYPDAPGPIKKARSGRSRLFQLSVSSNQ
jgi:hypothetical protein